MLSKTTTEYPQSNFFFVKRSKQQKNVAAGLMDLISQAFEREREGNKLENWFSCSCPNSLVSKKKKIGK